MLGAVTSQHLLDALPGEHGVDDGQHVGDGLLCVRTVAARSGGGEGQHVSVADGSGGEGQHVGVDGDNMPQGFPVWWR